MSFPRYPAYKDSGVEWLGEVPDHWDYWRLSHAFGTIGSGTTPPSNEVQWYENGTIPWVTTGELREGVITESVKCVTDDALRAFTALRIYPVGSLVIAMYGATIGRLGILGVAATTNQACCVLCQPQHLLSRFCFYWFQGLKDSLIAWYATGGGQPNINQQILAQLRVPAPTLYEQGSIATFLDRETAKIDALVADYRALIELLHEKRQAVISHAVTKGLDPSVPMKDSGVEWLGEVPEHWSLGNLKRVGTFKAGTGFPTEAQGMEGEELDFHKVASLAAATAEGFLLPSGNTVSRETARQLGAFTFPARTIVFAKVGAALLLGRIRELQAPGCIDNNMMGLLVNESEFEVSFVRYSMHLVRFDLLANPGAVPSLNEGQIAAFVLPWPDHYEQTAIATFLDHETAKIDALIQDAQSAITLLQERRSALISAAVTGKIDVRGLVAIPENELVRSCG